MIAHARQSARRSGLTLLEVLLALAIFLFSLVALSQLVGLATESARDVQWQSRAIRLAQSKLNEVVGGAVSLTGGSSGTFEEEEEWQWSVDAQSENDIQNLYLVTVRVWRDRPDGVTNETTLTQYVIDPAQRGGITQQDPQSQDSSTTQGQGSQSTPMGSSGSSGSPSSGSSGGSSPIGGAMGGSTRPSSGSSGGNTTRPSSGSTGGSMRPSSPSSGSTGGSRPSTGSSRPSGGTKQ